MAGPCPPTSIKNMYNLSNSVKNRAADTIEELLKFIQEPFDGENNFMDVESVTCNSIENIGE